MKTILKGFIGGIILWAIIYGLVNYVALPPKYHDALVKVLGIPTEVIVFLVKILREKTGVAITESGWFIIQPVSWGILSALVFLLLKIIRF